MRSQGVSELDKVSSVILETDGSLSILTGRSEGKADALANVKGIKDKIDTEIGVDGST